MRALVTGARGFAGSWLAQGAARVRGARSRRSIARARPPSGLALLGIEGEVDDVDRRPARRRFVRALLRKNSVDAVFHLAAQPIVGDANASPIPTFETNIEGTWVLLEACREAGVEGSSSPPRTRPTGPTTSCPTRRTPRSSRSSPTTSPRPRPT